MRLKRNRRTQIHLHPLTVTKDAEGVPNKNYVEGIPLHAIVWPATSKLQIEQYGNEINRVLNVKLEGKYLISREEESGVEVFQIGIGDVRLRENDGIRIHAKDKPDYCIVSIKPYRQLLLEVKRL